MSDVPAYVVFDRDGNEVTVYGQPEPTGLMHARVFGLMTKVDGTAPVYCGARPSESEATNDLDKVTCPACRERIRE